MASLIDLTDPIQVVVVDDFPAIRLLLKVMLPFYDIEVVGEADGAQAALRVVETLEEPPEVVILDVDMPITSGLDAIAPLKERAPEAKILMFSSDGDKETRDRAFAEGADGFIRKGVLIPEIVERIQLLAASNRARSADGSRA